MPNPWMPRVGGEYRSRSNRYSVIVTDIAENNVYAKTVLANGLGANWPVNLENFRLIYQPEDQSPIPKMKGLLERLVVWQENVNSNPHVPDMNDYCNHVQGFVAEARELLAGMEGK